MTRTSKEPSADKHRKVEISSDRFLEIFNTLEGYIENRYCVPISISDIPFPFTGDLDGRRIWVDFKENVESAVFIVAHLFGHTVQWNVCSHARELGLKRPNEVRPSEIQKILAYEKEACGYSMQLMHDAGIFDSDAWLANFSACDLAFLEYFYKTGKRIDPIVFWKDDQPLVQAIQIPEFTPKKWISRQQGTVLALTDK